MKSIFELKTRNDQLSSSNQGLTNYKYQEVQSLKSASGANFSDGQLVYRWTYGAQKYWIPNKSYVKIQCKLENARIYNEPREKAMGGGETVFEIKRKQLYIDDNIALSMNAAPQLFQSMQYKIADMMVSQVTENLAQVDTLKNRMNKSGHWLNTVGKSNNYWQACFQDRLREVANVNEINTNDPWRNFDEFLVQEEGSYSDLVKIQTQENGLILFTFTDVTITAGSRLRFRAAKATEASTMANTGDIVQGIEIGDSVVWTYRDDTADTISRYSGTIEAVTSAGTANPPGNIANTITVRPVHSLAINPVPTKITGNGELPSSVVYETLIKVGLNMEFFKTCEYQDNARSLSTFDLIWQPALSVFDVQHAIPCASTKHELTFTPFPNSVYQKNIIESLLTDKVHGTDYNFEVVDMRLYILTCDSNPVADEMQFMLDLDEVHCQASILTAETQQTSLDVVGSTNGITLAFQDSAVNNNSLYALSKFRIRDNIESTLERYYIRYEGQVPQPDFDGKSEYDVAKNTNIETLSDIYNRSLLYGGSYFKDSAETIQEFRERGMYMYHPFPKTASSRNTRVYTQTNFKADAFGPKGLKIQPRLLLFQHYKKVVVCKIVNGRIVQVTPIDA